MLTLQHSDKLFNGYTATSCIGSITFASTFNTSTCTVTLSLTKTTVAAHVLTLGNTIKHLI